MNGTVFSVAATVLPSRVALTVVVGFAAILASGCATVPGPAPADFSQPGWSIRRGQAVWRMQADAPELAGDLLVATHPDGRAVVEFSKTPLPLVVAQRDAESWQVQVVPQNRRYAGRGEPPARLLWLHLAAALAAGTPPASWEWKAQPDGSVQFQVRRRGETVRGYLAGPETLAPPTPIPSKE